MDGKYFFVYTFIVNEAYHLRVSVLYGDTGYLWL